MPKREDERWARWSLPISAPLCRGDSVRPIAFPNGEFAAGMADHRPGSDLHGHANLSDVTHVSSTATRPFMPVAGSILELYTPGTQPGFFVVADPQPITQSRHETCQRPPTPFCSNPDPSKLEQVRVGGVQFRDCRCRAGISCPFHHTSMFVPEFPMRVRKVPDANAEFGLQVPF